MIPPLILAVRQKLSKQADEKTKLSFQRFFKEPVKFHGVKSAVVGKISHELFPKNLPKAAIFKLCEVLFRSGYCEEAWIASNWVYSLHAQFEPTDFEIFQNWLIKYIDNWAECDTFCNHTVGAFIDMYPGYLQNLKTWTKSNHRWLKRASAVSLIIPAKNGQYLKDVFEIADELLLDSDEMVQKGYGWLLKVASSKHQSEVFAYVMKHKAVMPRTALRYAIEKLPPALRASAMKK